MLYYIGQREAGYRTGADHYGDLVQTEKENNNTIILVIMRF